MPISLLLIAFVHLNKSSLWWYLEICTVIGDMASFECISVVLGKQTISVALFKGVCLLL